MKVTLIDHIILPLVTISEYNISKFRSQENFIYHREIWIELGLVNLSSLLCNESYHALLTKEWMATSRVLKECPDIRRCSTRTSLACYLEGSIVDTSKFPSNFFAIAKYCLICIQGFRKWAILWDRYTICNNFEPCCNIINFQTLVFHVPFSGISGEKEEKIQFSSDYFYPSMLHLYNLKARDKSKTIHLIFFFFHRQSSYLSRQ